MCHAGRFARCPEALTETEVRTSLAPTDTKVSTTPSSNRLAFTADGIYVPTEPEAFMAIAVDTVRRFYDALGRGDVPAVLSLFDVQIEWTEAELFPYYGAIWQGPHAVVDNLLTLSSDWDRFSAKAHEFIAEGDSVVSLGTYSGNFKKIGRSFLAPLCPHLDSARRQASEGQHAQRHRQDARGDGGLTTVEANHRFECLPRQP